MNSSDKITSSLIDILHYLGEEISRLQTLVNNAKENDRPLSEEELDRTIGGMQQCQTDLMKVMYGRGL